MTKLRTDHRGRALKIGESQRTDGRYLYKYVDSFGKMHSVYSWKLVPSDKLPKEKRNCSSLREKEKEIQKFLAKQSEYPKEKTTLCQLYEKYNLYRSNVKKGTVNQRKKLMTILEQDPLGRLNIDAIKMSDAKEWVLRMKEKGYSYQTINNHKRTLKAAFYLAMEDEYVKKNPFDFLLSTIIEDTTKKKQALTEEEIEKLLSFVKQDTTYKRYYDEIVILLNTGMRISELCGLTRKDIDWKEKVIYVRHQILKDSKTGYYIESPKSKSGIRDIPMSNSVYEAFLRVNERKQKRAPIIIGDCSDFLFLNRKGYPMTNNLYAQAFSHLTKKFNANFSEIFLPKITPHILRHTFCTRLANKNMNPKNLQYLMGHSDINITLNLYAHVSLENMRLEIQQLLE